MNMSTIASMFLLVILLIGSGNAWLVDWIWGGSNENAVPTPKIGDIPIVKVPFEITTEDEEFLREAKNYTSLKLADLDDCQHHVSNEFVKFINAITDIMTIFMKLKQYGSFAGCHEDS
jgi:hypothetical protein